MHLGALMSVQSESSIHSIHAPSRPQKRRSPPVATEQAESGLVASTHDTHDLFLQIGSDAGQSRSRMHSMVPPAPPAPPCPPIGSPAAPPAADPPDPPPETLD